MERPSLLRMRGMARHRRRTAIPNGSLSTTPEPRIPEVGVKKSSLSCPMQRATHFPDLRDGRDSTGCNQFTAYWGFHIAKLASNCWSNSLWNQNQHICYWDLAPLSGWKDSRRLAPGF